jgi:hypothetical protein
LYAAGFTTGAGLAACAAGLDLAAFVPGLPGLLGAAITIGLGTALITPLGFAALAASAPEGRLGQTMGAAEVGRELGDAGGPLLVGVIAAATLTGGLAARGPARPRRRDHSRRASRPVTRHCHTLKAPSFTPRLPTVYIPVEVLHSHRFKIGRPSRLLPPGPPRERRVARRETGDEETR